MLRQQHWRKTHPYHYLMEILVEKYVQFLIRKSSIGDIMPESRKGKDAALQAAYDSVRANGCDFATRMQIASVLRGPKLKFREKKDNVAGLQLCDLIAHPSHIYTRTLMQHDVTLGRFSSHIIEILLQQKYDRSPWTGKVKGYGVKHLPQ